MAFLVVDKDYKFKPHICSSKDIAELVKADLSSRGANEPHILGDESIKCHMDLGGIIRTSAEKVAVSLNDTEFSLWTHQFINVLNRINLSIDDVRDGSYIKLHGHWTCVCVSVEEANKIKQHINDNFDLYKVKEQEYVDSWNKFIEEAYELDILAKTQPPKPEDVN